jgi:hypothetical protein
MCLHPHWAATIPPSEPLLVPLRAVEVYPHRTNPNPEGTMNAKRFLYVAAGILLLVVAYSVGAHRADAQASGSLIGVAGSYASGLVALDSSGQLYYRRAGATTSWQPLGFCPPGIPVVLNYEPLSGNTFEVGMSNGDVYQFWFQGPAGPLTFVFLGSVFGGAVQIDPRSWSEVKEMYRK